MQVPHLFARGARSYWLAAALLALFPFLSDRSRAQAPPTQTLTFAPVADTYVDAGSAGTAFGSAAVLKADASPARISYLRFTVTGVNGRTVQQARLRLGVNAGSSVGGTVHRIGSTTWNEATVTYSTRPALDGPGLATLGTVATGAVVEFGLGTAITGDGTYSLAIDTTSSSVVTYNSSAATSGQKPALVLTVAAPPPTVTIAQPPDGARFYVGDPVTLQGSATDATGANLSAGIAWRSSLAGALGIGPLVTATLGQGSHTVTASVTDGQGLTGSSQVGLTVTPRPPVNTEPLVTITAPGAGQVLATGVPVRLNATANDLEDGSLETRLVWTSDRDGALGTGGGITHALSLGPHQITASVVDSGGLVGAATISVQVQPAVTIEVPVTADASVDAAQPGVNFGTGPLLRVDANTARIAFLRFVVAHLGTRIPTRALLRLQVDATAGAESDSGGTAVAILDPSWTENQVTYATRPTLAGPPLASVGAVTLGQVVDFDVSTAVTGTGAYDFALVNVSSDEATYRSREGGPAPRLVLTVPDNAPVVTITAPADQSVVFRGDAVALAARATDVEDGDLTAGLEWTSSLDGPLGTGAAVTTAALTVGTHTLTAAVTDGDGLRGEARVTIRVRPPNLPPAVTITAPVYGTSVPVGSAVILAATAIDDVDGALGAQLRWTSSLAGALGTGTPLSSTRLGVGTHTLSATVTDSDGAVGTAQVTLSVLATPPTVTITAPAPGTRVFVGTTVTLSGTASDAVDGDLSASLRWSSDRSGLVGTGASVATAGLAVGTHTITATATNGHALTGSAERTLVVRPPNVPPTVTVVAPGAGATLLAGKPVLLAATTADAEDGDLGATVHWTSSRDGALGAGGVLVAPGLSAGTHTLTATATDHDGAAVSASVTVTVVPSTLAFVPTADTYVDSGSASSKFGTATSLLAGTSPVRRTFLRFAVSGVAPFTVQQASLRLTVGSASSDGSTAGGTVRTITNTTWSEATTTYNVQPVIDGPVLATRGAVTPKQVVDFDVTPGVPGDGTYNFALIGTTSDWVRYASREATTGRPALVVTLGQNLAPLVTITAPPSGTRVLPGTPVTFSATAVDAESGNLGSTLAWRSDRDGALGTGPAITTTALSPGRHTVTAEVVDTGGRHGQAQIILEVAHPPVVAIRTPADGTVLFASALPLTLTGDATDVEDGNLSGRIEWRSNRDGALASGQTITAAAPSVGTHVITATIVDDDGLVAEARVTIRVRAPNAAPAVTISAPADGATVPAGTPSSLTATALDDFDGDLGSQLRWTSSRDGILGTGAVRTVTLSEGVHTLTAAATDSDGTMGSAQVRLTVTPTPPVVTITAPAPGTRVFVGTSLGLAASATDATDGNLGGALRWFSDRDGLLGTGASLATSRLSVGTHVVTALATDRGGLAGRADRTVVIRPPNVPPTVTVLTPTTGGALLTGKPVLLGARATDVEDGDLAPAVRWTSSRDGVLGTGRSLVVPALSAGTHTLTAAVTDRDGAPATAAVTVTVIPPSLTFTAVADTYVDAGSAGTKFGTATSLLVGTSPLRQAFLRFTPVGIGSFTVQQAVLRLTVGSKSSDGSLVGGSVHALATTAWSEAATTYNTRPAITGAALVTKGKVAPKQVVDFDVTPAIITDGTYDIALDSTATDSVRYASREATTGKPQLLVTLTQDTAPLVSITTPPTGTVVDAGTTVTFTAVATDAESGDLGSRITWRSDRDGLLGNGTTLVTASLRPGVHTITAQVSDAGGHGAQAVITLAVAAPPVLTITAPAGSASTVPGAPLLLRATATDIVDGDLSGTIAWTSDLDGSLGTGGTLSVTTLRSGRHTLTATVSDSRGQQASAATTVVVNAPPTLVVTAPADGSVFLPAESITLTATASDVEDGSLTAGIAWTSSLDGALGRGGTLLVTTLRSGTHTITASVTDAGGKTTSARITLVVNAAPTVAITAPVDGITVAPGDTVSLTATANDVEDGDLSDRITWASNLDGPLGTGRSRAVHLLHSGTHTLTATVTDAGGKIASARIAVIVNAPPTLGITAPANGATVAPGDPVLLAATAHDAEDGNPSDRIAWASSLDGPLGIGRSLAVPTLRSGTHTLTATVSDTGGKTATAHVTLIVNAAPTLAVTAPAGPLDVAPGEAVALAATAHDTEDGDLDAAITWSSNLDGPLGTGATLTVSTLRSGSHTVTASVTDAGGRTATARVTVVVNAPPIITLTAPADGTVVLRGTPLLLTATAHDAEDGDLGGAIAWSSNLDGALGSSGTLSIRTLRSGTHEITASVTDAGGKTAAAHTTVVVDAAPAVFISAPAPHASFLPGEAIGLAGTATDAEDGPLSAALAWSSDLDGPLGTGATLSVSTLRSGTHTLTAAVTDASGKSASDQVVVVVNAAPTVAITAPADGLVTVPGAPVACVATAGDAEDGDLTPSISWSSDLDGPLGTGGTLTVSTLRSGTHTLTATVTDAGGRTASAHTRLVVNAPPTLTVTAPADGSTTAPGDPVTLSAIASDLEDGNLGGSVAWTSSLDGPLGTGTPLVTSALRSGIHTLTATVTDAGGKAATAHVTLIVNAPPTLAITTPPDGTSVLPGDPLALTATAHDAEDGDLGDAIRWDSSRDGALGTGRALVVSTLHSGTHLLTAAVTDAGGRTTAAHLTVVVNAAPTLAVTAPAEGTTVSPGEPVTLIATATDTEDGDLRGAVTWTSSLDGPLGTGSPLTVSTLRAGAHVLTATVTDAGGRTAVAPVTVVVNAAPTLAITAPAGGTITEPGAPVSLRAAAHDPEDGDLAAAVAWTSSLDGALGAGSPLVVGSLRSGTHTITATVHDSGGKVASAQLTLTIDATPTLAITAPAAGAVFAPGDTITLTAIAVDLEDGDLGATIAWSSSRDGALGTGTALPVATLHSGTHVLTATVTDGAGRTAVAHVTVAVNATPTLTIVAPAAGAVFTPGGLVTLHAPATDLEDGDLGAVVAWASSLDGPLGTGATLGVSTLRSGMHVLTATVVDGGGKTAAANVSIVVNAAPTVAITAPAEGAFLAPGEPATLAATATDAEDGNLGGTIAWTSTLDGPLGTGATLTVSTLRTGTHTLTAAVTDSGGRSASAHRVVVVDTAPIVTITAPAAGALFAPGDAVALSASATDAEDGNLGAAVAWASSLDGPLGTGATLAVTTLRSGTHTVTAAITDAAGRIATASTTVVMNAPPTVTIGAPVDGALVAAGSIVTLSAAASDAEDGDLGTTIAWSSSVDGPLGVGRTLAVGTLTSGTHTLTAAVTDGGGRNATATISLVVAPLVTLTGTFSTPYNNLTLAPQTRLDAHAATFLAGPNNLYPLNLGGDVGVRVLGGTVLGQYDPSWSWDQMHSLNNAGLAFTNADLTVDGLRIDNVTDAIRPRAGDGFVVRNTWVTNARDDCLEDDHLQGGLVDDTLFDGCYEAFSARPSPAIIASGYNGRGKLLTVQNSLIRLQPMPGPRSPSPDNLGTNTFFKWHDWDVPANSLSPDLALHGNVFMAERVGQAGADRMGIPPGHLRSCSNNVMVWLGSGPYPAPLPACFTVTTDRAVWDAAVTDWIARHPTVGH